MQLEEFIKSDRQWPRHMRIAHAQFQLNKATTKEDQDFWKAVLKRNSLIDKT